MRAIFRCLLFHVFLQFESFPLFFFFFLAVKTFQITEYTPNFLSHTTWADLLILARTPSEINYKISVYG